MTDKTEKPGNFDKTEKAGKTDHPPPAPAMTVRERLTRQSGIARRASPAHVTHVAEEQEDWVISYMDMVTLLLVVFLAMTAFLFASKPPPESVVRTSDSAASFPTKRLPGKAEKESIYAPSDDRRLREGIAIAAAIGGVDIAIEDRRVMLTIRDRVLFASAQADLNPQGREIIRKLSDALDLVPGLISVEGHTDDAPIVSPRFPSNWELSASRASTVVRELIGHGIPPSRMRAIGYAETKPVATNSDATGRSFNRRVTFVVEP